MAFSTISKSSSYFNSTIYTGNGTVDTALTTGTFQPDLTWFKNRGTTESHMWMDAVRGATNYIQSNSTAAQGTSADKISAFTSTGVTLGSGAETNENSQPLVCWAWKANGSGSANSDGTTSSTVSANTTAGFSIVQHSGSGDATTIGHGLGVEPTVVLTKRTSATNSWFLQQAVIGGSWTSSNYLILNSTAAAASSSSIVNGVTSSTISFAGADDWVNASGSTYIHYVFAEKLGYSKFGTYTGNGVADGTFVYLGFKPAFMIIKRTDSTTNWVMYDNKRDPSNRVSKVLLPDNSASETSGSQYIDFLSNGFKLRNSGNNTNDGSVYFFMAFGQPIVSTNNNIATAF